MIYLCFRDNDKTTKLSEVKVWATFPAYAEECMEAVYGAENMTCDGFVCKARLRLNLLEKCQDE